MLDEKILAANIDRVAVCENKWPHLGPSVTLSERLLHQIGLISADSLIKFGVRVLPFSDLPPSTEVNFESTR